MVTRRPDVDSAIDANIDDFLMPHVKADLRDVIRDLDGMDGSVVYLAAGDDAPHMLLFRSDRYVAIDVRYSDFPDISLFQVGDAPNKAYEFMSVLADIVGQEHIGAAVPWSVPGSNGKAHTEIPLLGLSGKCIRLVSGEMSDTSLVQRVMEQYLPVKLLMLKGPCGRYDLSPYAGLISPGGYIIEADKYLRMSHKALPGFHEVSRLLLPVQMWFSPTEVYMVEGIVSKKE